MRLNIVDSLSVIMSLFFILYLVHFMASLEEEASIFEKRGEKETETLSKVGIKDWSAPEEEERLKKELELLLRNSHLKKWEFELKKEYKDPKEKFFTWNPHSGISNQKISLLNALLIAIVTNRTIVLPDVTLKHSSYLTNFEEQRETANKIPRIPHFFFYDLTELGRKFGVRFEHWCNFGAEYVRLEEEGKVFKLQEEKKRYELVLVDTLKNLSATSKERLKKHMENKNRWFQAISLSDLEEKTLIHFNSLFGTGRFISLKKQLNFSTVSPFIEFSPLVLHPSERVFSKLRGRGNFLAMHLRIGSHKFAEAFQANKQKFYKTLESMISGFVTQKNCFSEKEKKSIPIYISTDGKLDDYFTEKYENIFLSTDIKELNNENIVGYSYLDEWNQFFSQFPAYKKYEKQVRNYLVAFVEQYIPSNSRGLVLTKGSTFSGVIGESFELNLKNKRIRFCKRKERCCSLFPFLYSFLTF